MMFFIHIPKTGGTSIHNVLRKIVPGGLAWYVDPDSAPPNFLSRPGVRDSTVIYAGHFTYSHIKQFLAADDKIYSVVRDPIARVFSHFNHIGVRDTNHPLHGQVRNRNIIEAASACPRFLSEINNNLCLFLSGHRNFEITRQVIGERAMKIYTINQLTLLVSDIAAQCGMRHPPGVNIDNASDTNYMARVTNKEIEFVKSLNEEDCALFSDLSSDFNCWPRRITCGKV